MDEFCHVVEHKLDDVLGKLEQIHSRLLNVENKVEQLKTPTIEPVNNEVCIIVDKPQKNEEINIKRISKYKTTLKTNFFDNKNETKWVIQNKIMKKALKIQTMKISRLELKEKMLLFMNYDLCLTERQVEQLNVMDCLMELHILMNEKMQIHCFESFINLIMNKHCIKK